MEITNEDFLFFQSECKYWIEKWGLKNWKIYFRQIQLSRNTIAESNRNLDYVATIFLTLDMKESVVDDKPILLKETAKHETLHILLARLVLNAQARYVSEDDIFESEHEVIRVLEKE